MENHQTKQEQSGFSQDPKNEFLLELKELISRAPKNISVTIIAAENVQSKEEMFEGLIMAVGSPKKILSMYQTVFDHVPELKNIIFDAVSYHKFKEMNSQSPASIFETIFGPGFFKR